MRADAAQLRKLGIRERGELCQMCVAQLCEHRAQSSGNLRVRGDAVVDCGGRGLNH